MVLTVAAAIAVCSWASPGADPYMGDILAAVERYRDIPPEVRGALKARMLAHQYDDIAVITRDTIRGVQTYTDLRDMHFGEGRLCGRPSRALWSTQHVERGLVYCEAEHCLIVPTVCRNVSRVTRTTTPPVLPPTEPPVEIPGGPDLAQQRLALQGEDTEIIAPAKPIPEPSTLALLALGLGLLWWVRKEKRNDTTRSPAAG